uniref:Uncharacterized protein n=1 Tax=Peronospora matthiolae TaxID=2874970 RepID=A0AAV1VDB7_9STRA
MKGIPILLFAGETVSEEDDAFVYLVHYLKAKGQLRKRTRYASATKVAASAGKSVANNQPTRTTSGGERPRSRDDHGHDAQKRPKHMGSLAEESLSRHKVDDTHAHRAKSVAAGVPVEAHEKLVLEVKGLQEAFGKSQCMLDAMQSRLKAIEQAQTRSEAQLDFLIRLQQSGSVPLSSAQAPPSSHGKDPGTA